MKPHTLRGILLVIAVLCCIPLLPAQQTASIEISGDVQKPMTLTAADLSAMPRVTASIGTTTYQGVLLDEILKRAGVAAGPTLRGKVLTTCVIAEASDGYQVAFSLGELDPSVTDSPIVLADSSDGKPLSGDQGPFRLVIPKDHIGLRSVHMLTKLTVVQLKK